MGLSVACVQELVRQLQELAPGEDAARALRQRVHSLGVPVLQCDPEDLRGEAPFLRQAPYALHLVDASQHCWQLVDDPAHATAVVLSRLP